MGGYRATCAVRKWFLALANCAQARPGGGLEGRCQHCSQDPAGSQMAAVGQCLSLFLGFAAFAGADVARMTPAYTKQKPIWEKRDLFCEEEETLPVYDGQRYCR